MFYELFRYVLTGGVCSSITSSITSIIASITPIDCIGLSADKNLYGCIYDGNLNQIEYDSHYEDGDVQITASMSAGETYYMKVMHESPAGAGKFKLAVTEHHELQAYVAGTTLTESLVTVKPDQNKTLSVDVPERTLLPSCRDT